MSFKEKQNSLITKGAANITKWIGSPVSVTLHTILFIVSFTIPYAGLVSFERMLLVLTTIVSLEAIYLSIFIQMSINMNNQNIETLSANIEEISDDIEEISDDIEELGEDIEELGEDEVPVKEIDKDKLLLSIQAALVHLQKDMDQIKLKVKK